MMFADNQRISHRQLIRQLILSLGVPILLCLPGSHHILGANGVLGILVNFVIYYFAIILFVRIAPAYQDLTKTLGSFQGRFVAFLYLIPLVLAGAYLLSVTSSLACTYLISGVPKWLAGLLISGVCAAGSHMGLEKRGRIGEVSCGLIIGGFLLLYVLACFQGESVYINDPVQGAWNWQEGLESSYAVFCALSFLGFLPFLLPWVSKPNSSGKLIFYGVLFLGGMLAAVLILSQAAFGWERLIREKSPILPLMAGTNLPGDVLARFDVLWIALLIFGLFFSLGSVFFYGSHILEQAGMLPLRFCLLILVYAVAFGSWNGYSIEEWFGQLLVRMIAPLMLVLTFYVAIWYKSKNGGKGGSRARFSLLLLLTAVVFALCGCSGVDPEKRMYPLAMSVDYENGQYQVTYEMADLPEATGQEKPEENGVTGLALSGRDFQEIDSEYDRSQEKYLDISHLEVLILGEELLRQNQCAPLFNYLKGNPLVGEDMYVFRAADVDKVMSYQGEDGESIGEYLVGIYENRPYYQKRSGITLRQVYNSWYGQEGVPPLPLIKLKKHGPYL